MGRNVMLFPLHPILYFAAQKLIIAFLLAFTAPASVFRPALFPVLLVCNYYLLPSYTLFIPRSAWMGFVAGEVLTGPLDYVEKLLLSQWSFEDRGPSAKIRKRAKAGKWPGGGIEDCTINPDALDPGRERIRDRLKFGVWTVVSNRHIASPYQARNVPPYPISNPAYVPTCYAFLLRRGFVFVACYLLTDVLVRGNQPECNPVVFAEEQVPFLVRLGDVTTHEMLTRVGTTIGFWVGAYASIQAYYNATAFFAVACGLVSPADPRPMFGSLSDA